MKCISSEILQSRMKIQKSLAQELFEPQNNDNAMSPYIFILFFHIYFRFCHLEMRQSWTSWYFPMMIPLCSLISVRELKPKADLSSPLLEWAPHKTP